MRGSLDLAGWEHPSGGEQIKSPKNQVEGVHDLHGDSFVQAPARTRDEFFNMDIAERDQLPRPQETFDVPHLR